MVIESISEAKVSAYDRRLHWKVFSVLMAGALLGVWAIIPYAFTLMQPMESLRLPFWLLLVVGTLQNLLLYAVVIGVGLWLGGKVGLAAPVLKGWLAGDPEAPRRFRAALPLSVGLGAAVGGAILVLDLLVFASFLPEALRGVSPPPWQGFLASFFGGINEELLMRLGLMTLLVWVGVKASRRHEPRGGVIWAANVVVALLFGAGHLLSLTTLVPLTTDLVVRTLLLNGLAGLVFGYVYWRHGLLLAMVSHFSADIMLHVVGGAFG
jgi:hypothetical protein